MLLVIINPTLKPNETGHFDGTCLFIKQGPSFKHLYIYMCYKLKACGVSKNVAYTNFQGARLTQINSPKSNQTRHRHVETPLLTLTFIHLVFT